MRTNALSVANYFIDLAKNNNKELRPLKLMKLVYIAYGYALALLDKSILDPRFDRVEAWKLGPVIPSVYHSFKMYGKSPITKKTTFIVSHGNGISIEEPELTDEDTKKVCDLVWYKYSPHSDSKLVSILHGVGTPWGRVYEEGMNREIPETLTRAYYIKLVNRLKEKNSNAR